MKPTWTYGGSIQGINLYLLLITLVLLALWIPALWDKLIDFNLFKTSMLRQYFPMWMNWTWVVAIPFVEAVIVVLLIRSRTNLYGMYLSFVLMLAFTTYTGSAIWLAWVKIPCGCNKLISNLSWLGHFWFNLFFLLLSGAGIYLSKKKQGNIIKDDAAEG